MNKEMFLGQLEQLLYDIPREEREEAMDYYRSYFEEAGVENEASVLEELDSPQYIAASIKEDLKRPGKEDGHLKNPPQVRGKDSEEGKKEANYRRYDEPKTGEYGRNEQARQDGQNPPPGAGSRYEQYEKHTQGRKKGFSMDNQAKLILLIILAVFSFPVWGSVASVILGIIGAAIAAVVVLAVLAVGGVVGGLVCAIVGIVNLCMLSLIKGLLALGAGMLLIAAGGISFVFVLLVCGRLIPWAVRQVEGLFRRLIDWGRGIA